MIFIVTFLNLLNRYFFMLQSCVLDITEVSQYINFVLGLKVLKKEVEMRQFCIFTNKYPLSKTVFIYQN